MEAVVALAVLLRRFDFALVPDQDVGMTTGATIHTQNGLYMTVRARRQPAGSSGVATGAQGAPVAQRDPAVV